MSETKNWPGPDTSSRFEPVMPLPAPTAKIVLDPLSVFADAMPAVRSLRVMVPPPPFGAPFQVVGFPSVRKIVTGAPDPAASDRPASQFVPPPEVVVDGSSPQPWRR